MYKYVATDDPQVIASYLHLGRIPEADTREALPQTARMEIWASSMDDAGEDFCEVRLLAADECCLLTRRVSGY